MPEGTLKALAKHGVIEATMPEDGGACGEVLARFAGTFLLARFIPEGSV